MNSNAVLEEEGVGSLEQLIEKHRHRVWRIAYRFLGNEEDALDVTQDVLLRLCRHFSRLRPGTRVQAWLYRVTANAALNASRNRVTRERRLRDAAAPLQAVSASPGTPGLAGDIARAIRILPGGQRGVVVLRLLDGRTFREIAEIFGVTEGTVKVQFARGLRRLRENLKEWR